MATLALPLERRAISVGRVLQRAMDTVRHNPTVSVALVLIFGVLPGFLLPILLTKIDSTALVMTVAGYPLPGAFALAILH